MILLLGEHRDVAPPVNQRNARRRWEEYKKRKRTAGAGGPRDFHDMVRDRARREAEFRRELLREAAQSMINGDFETARGLLRD